MATAEEIQSVLELLGEDWEDNGYDQNRIEDLLDAGQTPNQIAASYWEKVYTSTANFIDISESGSSRGLSAVTRNAKDLAALFRGRAEAEVPSAASGRTGIRSHRMRRV